MAQTERKKVVGRVGVFKIDHSLISREMEQDYIPPETQKEYEEFYTVVAETRDNFQVSDIGPGDVEHDAAIKQMVREMRDYNAKSPELTAGDIDAAWEEANVGDETPGGLHPAPTPDQDVVDDIGRAAGLTYEDDEPLRSVEKLRDRDVHRWELNPESADDDEELEDDEPHDPRPAKI
jgi:hypothetical protein